MEPCFHRIPRAQDALRKQRLPTGYRSGTARYILAAALIHLAVVCEGMRNTKCFSLNTPALGSRVALVCFALHLSPFIRFIGDLLGIRTLAFHRDSGRGDCPCVIDWNQSAALLA